MTAKQKEWVKAHPDRIKRYAAKWRAQPKTAAYFLKYAEEHRTAIRANKAKWQKNHRPYFQEWNRRRRYRIAETPNTRRFYEFVRSKALIPCYYCGRYINGKKAHVDHVFALSKTGNHSVENLCVSCPDCNTRKATKLPSELRFLPQPLLNL